MQLNKMEQLWFSWLEKGWIGAREFIRLITKGN